MGDSYQQTVDLCNQIFTRSEFRTSAPLGTSGCILSTKLATCQQSVYRPFGRLSSLKLVITARSSFGHALKICLFSTYSYSNNDWTAGCEVMPMIILLSWISTNFGFVTELVEENLWYNSCASLMMGATTPETSLVLVLF